MPAKKSGLRVILCASLTADGKLDATAPAVPPVLYNGDANPARHPWGGLYDGAAGILVSEEVDATLPVPQAAARTVVKIRKDTLSADGTAEGLRRLAGEGFVGCLLCFGGAELFRALLEAGLADELRLIVRPAIDGRRGSPSLSGASGPFFPASVTCRLVSLQPHGDDCLLYYRVKRPAWPRRLAA